MILYNYVPFRLKKELAPRGSLFFPLRAVPFGMENSKYQKVTNWNEPRHKTNHEAVCHNKTPISLCIGSVRSVFAWKKACVQLWIWVFHLCIHFVGFVRFKAFTSQARSAWFQPYCNPYFSSFSLQFPQMIGPRFNENIFKSHFLYCEEQMRSSKC